MAKTCKFYKYQRYVSYDNGATWQPLQEFQKGGLIEYDSPDCGGGIDMYKWVVLDINEDFYCEDCEGEEQQTQYRWVYAASDDDYICYQGDKYKAMYKQISNDYGETWENVVPLVREMSNYIIEENTASCGYAERWVELPHSQYMCSGTTKYSKEIKQVSYDSGQTWSYAVPEEARMGSVIETSSPDCGYVAPPTGFTLTETIYKNHTQGTSTVAYPRAYFRRNGQMNWYNLNYLVTPTEVDYGDYYVATWIVPFGITTYITGLTYFQCDGQTTYFDGITTSASGQHIVSSIEETTFGKMGGSSTYSKIEFYINSNSIGDIVEMEVQLNY